MFSSIASGLNIVGKCEYKSAPIKTLSRLTLKAATDYNHRQWPHCVHVIDLVRCSVTLQTPKDLINTFSAFQRMIGTYNKDPRQCIKKIARIKNGFAEIPDVKFDQFFNVFFLF